MVSISGAMPRFRLFIWNSHSKSETARSPLTMARAPRERANSTTSVVNPSTVMFDAESSEAWMNRMRSSSVNIVCLCRGWRTTATITRSNRPDARRITSRWPVVTGSYVPGQTAIVSGMGEDGDAGAAVRALGQGRQGQLGGGAGGVGLEHGAAAGREQRRQVGREAVGQGRQHLVGRIEEYQVVRQAEI